METFSRIVRFVVSAICLFETLRNSAATWFTRITISFFNLKRKTKRNFELRMAHVGIQEAILICIVISPVFVDDLLALNLVDFVLVIIVQFHDFVFERRHSRHDVLSLDLELFQ